MAQQLPLAMRDSLSVLIIFYSFRLRTGAHCYKTYYNRNLQMFLISSSVCHWPTSLMFVVNARSLSNCGAPEICFT
jgi:hypothetical protein